MVRFWSVFVLLACACSSPTSGRILEGAGDAGDSGTDQTGCSAGTTSTGGAAGSAGAGGSAGAQAGAGSGGTAAGEAGAGGEPPGGAGGSAGASAAGASGSAGTGGAVSSGGTGGSGPDLGPTPADNCPGYFDWYVPEGTCIWVRGRFTQQNAACDVYSPSTRTCATATAPAGGGTVRASATVGVVDPSDIMVTRFDTVDGSCPKTCPAP